MSDLIDIASKEIGYKEGSNNYTKYGKWYGMPNAQWCQMFVSWCANQAGISTNVVPKTASTSAGMAWYKEKGRFKAKGSYTPKRNDIIYFKTGASHVGIVEYVSGNTVHTIEGNTSNKVARRNYSLSHSTITGYGVASDFMTSSSGSTSESGTTSTSASDKSAAQKEAEVAEELKYLNKVLALTEQEVPSTVYDGAIQVTEAPELTLEVIINHNGTTYSVSVEDGLQVTWERTGQPGKLTFSVPYDDVKPVWVGDAVAVRVSGENFFKGYVFTIRPKIERTVEVTVYDQLRYFKNKDTYLYSNQRASQLFSSIAYDFGLRIQHTDDTKVQLTRNEENQTLFDIMENALSETLMQTGKIYTFYDDFGGLVLKEVWKVDSLITEISSQDYDYQVSIDGEYYNQIKLGYENEETGTMDHYISQHSENIAKFGLLQKYETIKSPKLGKLKGEMLLKQYNKVERTITINDIIGNTKVRAGCLIPVLLDLYDVKISGYMLVTKVTHKFSNNEHYMSVTLTGGVLS